MKSHLPNHVVAPLVALYSARSAATSAAAVSGSLSMLRDLVGEMLGVADAGGDAVRVGVTVPVKLRVGEANVAAPRVLVGARDVLTMIDAVVAVVGDTATVALIVRLAVLFPWALAPTDGVVDVLAAVLRDMLTLTVAVLDAVIDTDADREAPLAARVGVLDCVALLLGVIERDTDSVTVRLRDGEVPLLADFEPLIETDALRDGVGSLVRDMDAVGERVGVAAAVTVPAARSRADASTTPPDANIATHSAAQMIDLMW